MELEKDSINILQFCNCEVSSIEEQMRYVVMNNIIAHSKTAKLAYIKGYNSAVKLDAKATISFDEFEESIMNPGVAVGADPCKSCDRNIPAACDDCPHADPNRKPLPDPDNDLEEAAEIEAEKEQPINAKKEARAGMFDMLDYRHALKEPGKTMCGGDATVNIEITEGARVNCPLCIAEIEAVTDQP